MLLVRAFKQGLMVHRGDCSHREQNGQDGKGCCCCLSQQQASISQGRICSDKFTCCHTEIEVVNQTLHLTQLQYTDTGPTSTDPTTPGTWQGSHWSVNFEVTGITRPRKNSPTSEIRTRDLPLSRRNGKGLSPGAAENVGFHLSWFQHQTVSLVEW